MNNVTRICHFFSIRKVLLKKKTNNLKTHIKDVERGQNKSLGHFFSDSSVKQTIFKCTVEIMIH